ncbi:hypothetical protein GWN42_03895, partial [candidate division KSB1 bacterium]|nr:hypothetical protein [candidate division KSB1 bacterium]NIR68896.1 hypothetical protein [candidate division KSB1 bacterium]NIS24021.1 hypothetical protein [candidate division KSB1 bacterium]NIU24671.1 hypothetical protein [candidate division KSB1 bacterium]NIU89836.1 hypothetical protein [candidate division KSB1 bacterium]
MQININKLLKLHIRGKLAIAFVGLSILPVLVVGILGISSNINSLRRIAIENLNHDLFTIKERLEVFFEGMEENIHSLTASSSFKRLINKIDDHEALRSSPITSDLLAEFTAFAERK